MTESEGDHRAESRELGNRQIDEEDPPLDDVDPEIGVQAHQHQAGGKRRGHEAEHFSHLRAPNPGKAEPSRSIHRSTRSK